MVSSQTHKAPAKSPKSASSVTVGNRGKKIGRPVTRFEPLETLPTRCPVAVHTYLKGLAASQRITMTTMFEDMMRRFLQDRPWEHGLLWRRPKVATSTSQGVETSTNWQQANMPLPHDLMERVEQAAAANGVSKASLAYTAMFWWVQYIYPPSGVRQHQ